MADIDHLKIGLNAIEVLSILTQLETGLLSRVLRNQCKNMAEKLICELPVQDRVVFAMDSQWEVFKHCRMLTG